MRPHYLGRLGREAGVFVRLGSTNRRADLAQIDEMRRFGQFESFDEQPITELDSEALDFRVVSEPSNDGEYLRVPILETQPLY